MRFDFPRNFRLSRMHLFALILVMLYFYPYLAVGHHTFDDLRQSMATWQDWSQFANDQGRFLFLSLMGMISLMVHSITSLAMVKVVLISGVLLNIIAFSYLGRFYTDDKKIFWFLVVFYILLLPDNWDHSQVAAGPLVGTLPLTLYVLSLIFFCEGILDDKKQGKLIWSHILYILSLQFGESFVVLSLGYFITAYSLADRNKISYVLKKNSYIIAITVLYVIAYAVFRHFHQSTYGGNRIDWAEFSGASYWHTLWQFSIGSVPFLSFTDGYSPEYMPFHKYFQAGTFWENVSFLVRNFRDLSPVWFVQSIIGVYIFWIFKDRLKLGPTRKTILLMCLCATIVFGSNLLLALSVQYQNYVKRGVQRYVGSYYAYFGWILIIVTTYSVIRDRLNAKQLRLVFQGFVATAIFFAVFLNSFANSSIVSSKIAATARTRLADKLVARTCFDEVKDGSLIYSPDLLKPQVRIELPPPDYWDRYLMRKFKKKIKVTASYSDYLAFRKKNPEIPIYNVSLRTEKGRGPQFLIFSKLKSVIPDAVVLQGKSTDSILTDEAYIVPLDEQFTHSVIYQTPQGWNSKPWFFGVPTLKIPDRDIRIESIIITRQSTIDPPLSVSHKDGFFEQEFDGARTFFWSKKESELQIFNSLPGARRARFTAFIAMPFVSNKNIFINGKRFRIGESGSIVNLDLNLGTGQNSIRLHAEADQMAGHPGTDPRDLFFQLFNAKITILD